jgi:hypothetical protein
VTRRIIVALTNGALILAFAMAVVWLWTGWGKGESAVTVAALFAAIVGVRAERWAGARESRNRALEALRDELARNSEIIADERFRPLQGHSIRRRVFPRLNHSAADAAVTSGALGRRTDSELVTLLYQWRDAVRELNHRLDLTEVYLFSADVIQPEELAAFDQALHSADGILTEVSTQLESLEQALESQYLQRG